MNFHTRRYNNISITIIKSKPFHLRALPLNASQHNFEKVQKKSKIVAVLN
jgi:hypothetical protein